MEKMKFLKLLTIIGLTITLILTVTTLVFAADEEDPWANATVVESNTNTNNTTDNTATPDNTTDNSVSNLAGDTDNTANTNNTSSYDDDDEYVNNNTYSNDLAKTGIGKENTVISVIIVLGVIVAMYSFKKISEFKNV